MAVTHEIGRSASMALATSTGAAGIPQFTLDSSNGSTACFLMRQADHIWPTAGLTPNHTSQVGKRLSPQRLARARLNTSPPAAKAAALFDPLPKILDQNASGLGGDAFGLGDMGRDSVHKRRRQTIIGRQADFQPAARGCHPWQNAVCRFRSPRKRRPQSWALPSLCRVKALYG